jgi:DNA-binding MarR family transcriptional regulator
MVTRKHYAALDQILELAVLINDDMTRSLAQDGLTVSRTHLLWELRRRGPSTQRDLADALKVSARTVTGLVDGLETTGFVTRQPHPTDRRATLVTFTERGVRTVEEMERGQREFARLIFAEMAEERLDCFSGALGEILTRLREASRLTDLRGGDQ